MIIIPNVYFSKRLLFQLSIFSIIGLLLTACSSVPFSSMVKMSNLNDEAILSIVASEIRVRLSLPEPIELQTKNVRLVLKFEYKNDSHSEYEYQLEFIDVNKVNPVSNWFSSQPSKHAYRFKLSSLSQLEFNQYQKNHVKQGRPKSYYWNVYYYLKPGYKKNEQSENVKTQIDMELKLSKQEGYFFLLKNATITVQE